MNISFTAEQIAGLIGGEIRGDKNVAVHDVAGIEDAREGTLCFLSDEKYVHFLPETKASIVLMSKSIAFEGNTGATLILVDNARGAVAQLLQMVSEVLNPRKHGIEQPCFIAEGVQVPEDAYIGAYAYIMVDKGVKQDYNTGDAVAIWDEDRSDAGLPPRLLGRGVIARATDNESTVLVREIYSNSRRIELGNKVSVTHKANLAQ